MVVWGGIIYVVFAFLRRSKQADSSLKILNQCH